MLDSILSFCAEATPSHMFLDCLHNSTEKASFSAKGYCQLTLFALLDVKQSIFKGNTTNHVL